MASKWMVSVAMVVGLVLGGLTHAADDKEKGQAELDKATDLQLSAETLGDLEKVVELCEKALEKGLGPENQKFCKQLAASSLFEHGKKIASSINEDQSPNPRWQSYVRLALKDLDRALKFDNENAEVHLLRAKLNGLPGGDVKEAIKSATEAIRLFADENDQLAKAYLLRAKLEEDPAKQLADFDAAIKADPENPDAWQERAMLYLGRGDNEKAIADFKKLVEQDGKNAMAQFALAEALANLKKYDEALVHVAKGIEARPEVPFGFLLRAKVHAMQEKLDDALEDLNKALKVDPRDANALMMRARLYQEQENFEKARGDIDSILQLSPGNPQALLFRSSLYAAEKKFGEAIADVSRLIQKNPKNSELRLHAASLYSAGGWPRKGIAIITAILEKDPDNAMALRSRGDAYLSIGKHAEAVADFEKALKLEPDNSGVLNNYAWVLATSADDKIRKPKLALELGKKACEVTEYKMPHILSTLAACYADGGDFESAKQWSAKAVELGKGETKEQLQKELESYKLKKPWRESQEMDEKPNPPPLHDSPAL